MMMKTINFLLFGLLLVVSVNLFAQNSQSAVFTNGDNIAINGYDVVAYFTQNAAVRGDKKFSVEHGGATYYFSSEENKNNFVKNPDNYLPKYGGYCAYAIAKMEAKVVSDPTTFKLYNGELYLFYNDLYNGTPMNTIVPWNQDEANMIKEADKKWAKM